MEAIFVKDMVVIIDKNIMVDKGLVDAIIGLPTPTPDKLTVADIEEIS